MGSAHVAWPTQLSTWVVDPFLLAELRDQQLASASAPPPAARAPPNSEQLRPYPPVAVAKRAPILLAHVVTARVRLGLCSARKGDDSAACERGRRLSVCNTRMLALRCNTYTPCRVARRAHVVPCCHRGALCTVCARPDPELCVRNQRRLRPGRGHPPAVQAGLSVRACRCCRALFVGVCPRRSIPESSSAAQDARTPLVGRTRLCL